MDIIGIGKPCVDMIAVVDKMPAAGSGAGIIDFSRQGGGNVATALVAAARLGASAAMVGLCGTCVHSKAIREDFTYNNVDISRLKTIGGGADFAFILSDLEAKNRSIIYNRGSIPSLAKADLARDFTFISAAKFLHLEGCGVVEQTAAQWVRDRGGLFRKAGKVSVDASRYSEAMNDFLPMVDIFIGSEYYYKAAFDNDNYEENCINIAEKGPEIAVFTLGEKGCVGYSKKDGFFRAEGMKVNVVDTLGAGDVFHGAFLFGLTKGWDAYRTARFANAVSAIKVGYIGGRAGIPTCGAAERFMETSEFDDSELRERVEYYRNKWLFEN